MPAELTRRKRSLGRYMEALRRRPDRALTGEELAARSQTSQTTISRMEAGLQLPNKHLFAAILNALGINDTERQEALALWNRARVRTASVEHAADLPSKYLAFRRDESEASAELTINYVTLPGLLQTVDYNNALLKATSWAVLKPVPGWEERSADERRTRHQLLEGESPLRLHSILSEAVLHYIVGGHQVWSEQLEHLLGMGKRENITIQVVPFDRGPFGPMSGPATILCFEDDPETPNNVYLEYPAGGETIDNREEVSSFVAMFDDVRKLACPPDESASLIQTLLDKIKD